MSSLAEAPRPKKRTRRPVEERFGWRSTSEKGKYVEIDKNILQIDHAYQRDRVSQTRVMKYAKNWSWQACGTLLVARRMDGTLWVYDGQHRVLAARIREDIKTIPCLVFEVTSIREEAKAFTDTNVARGSVNALERYKARLASEESNALRIAASVDAIGYSIGKGLNRQIACVDALERAFRRNEVAAETALLLCAEVYRGDTIGAVVFSGLSYLEAFLMRNGLSIERKDIRDKLLSVVPQMLAAHIDKTVDYLGKSGDRVYAEAIVQFVNKRKRGKKIPSPMASPKLPEQSAASDVVAITG